MRDKYGFEMGESELIPKNPLKDRLSDFERIKYKSSEVDLIAEYTPKIDEFEHKLADIVSAEQMNTSLAIEPINKDYRELNIELVNIPRFEPRHDIERKGQINTGAYVVPLARKEQTYDPRFLKIGAGQAKPVQPKRGELEYSKDHSEFSHARIKRHKYAGKPLYFEVKFKPTKELGYMKRSLSRQFKSNPIELLPSFDKLIERLRKSRTHTLMGQVGKVEIIKTVELAGDAELAKAYLQLTENLLNDEMSRNQIDAWDIYIMEDAPQQIFDMYFEPTIMAFMDLRQHVRDFIRDNWDLYDQRKQTYLAKKSGRYFTKGDEDVLAEMMKKVMSPNDYSSAKNEWRPK